MPNILAYALYFNSWSLRIQILDAEENEVELYYVYAVIIRKLFLYDYLPDSLNDDLDPIEFTQVDIKRPAHLQATMDEADPETKDFINQYLDYSKLLGFALV